MDLLFKNPKYFFNTYFNISIWLFLLVVCSVFAVGIVIKFLSKTKISVKSMILEILFSLYLAVVISITLLGDNRQEIGKMILNPFFELQRIVFDNDIHAKREMLSNILFFVPFGILFPLNYNSKSPKAILIAGLLLSSSIEILQLIFSIGFAQTADILDNVIGALIGWLLLKIIQRLMYKLKNGGSYNVQG